MSDAKPPRAPRPRDAAGRFLPTPRPAGPWAILATNRAQLGAEIRAVNRKPGRVTALARDNQLRFATREEAEAHLAGMERSKTWRFTVQRLS